MYIGWGAFLLDCLIGDPRSSLHPVVLIGNLISFLEKLLYRPAASDRQKFWAGALLTFLVLAVCYGLAVLLLAASLHFPSLYFFPIVEIIVLCFMITPRTLAAAGREIAGYLAAGDLAKARFKVGWIVGRDTDNLTPAEVTRATVETIAENIVDGIISPLFYWWIGGVPFAVLYRAANTMDSMIGYKNEKYLYFGRAAARLDDVLNFIPARLTGFILVAAAWLWRFDWKNAWRMMRRDARKHPSPNGGYTEATVAGALGIRLGGMNYYFGRPSFRAYMGEPLNELEQKHIAQTTRLMYTATALFLLLVSLEMLWEGRLWL